MYYVVLASPSPNLSILTIDYVDDLHLSALVRLLSVVITPARLISRRQCGHLSQWHGIAQQVGCCMGFALHVVQDSVWSKPHA